MEQINANLSVVLLDDDDASLFYLKQLVTETKMANVVAEFNNPESFLQEFHKLQFDILMLDIEMPGISGKEIIKKLGKDRCIVNTASSDRYEETIKCHPIEVLIKPTTEKALKDSIVKARKIIGNPLFIKESEYLELNTSRRGGRILCRRKEIVFITTDEDDPRNKLMILRNGENHILMDYTFDELHLKLPNFRRPNNHTLLDPDIIIQKGYNFLILSTFDGDRKPFRINLTRTFHSRFRNI